ncbi:MAG TPA: tetratricopeptide repeat protein [Thermodesulfovibrionales bacterium]|nr:tetratricopeptide repeat protein [Thermodesulfovibrionales bacterium]
MRLNPYYEEAYTNWGVACAAKGQVDDATRQYQIALRLKPDDATARDNLEPAYKRKGLRSIPLP